MSLRDVRCVFVLIGLTLVATACGSHPNVAMRHGTIEVRRGVEAPSLLKGVLGISRGSSASAVYSAFGPPWTKVSPRFRGERETCWVYHAHQPETSLDALDFCMTNTQQVERILIGTSSGPPPSP
jgi:hypothetical protein